MRINSPSTPNESTSIAAAQIGTALEDRPRAAVLAPGRARPATAVHKSRLPRDPRRPLRITVVGAGGNGSQVMPCLARLDRACRSLGLPPLDVTLYDPDRVSPSNVARQLFYPDDVGQGKAVCLVNRLNLGFRLAWRAVSAAYPARREYRVGPEGSLASAAADVHRDGADVLITCVDTGAARRSIADACLASHDPPLYWLDLGNEDRTGQVWLGEFPRPGAPSKKTEAARLRTVVEAMPEFYDGSRPESDRPSCSLAEALESQDLFINDHVSRWGVTLLWRLIRSGEVSHRGYWINLKTGTVTPEAVYAPDAFRAAPSAGDPAPVEGALVETERPALREAV